MTAMASSKSWGKDFPLVSGSSIARAAPRSESAPNKTKGKLGTYVPKRRNCGATMPPIREHEDEIPRPTFLE